MLEVTASISRTQKPGDHLSKNFITVRLFCSVVFWLNDVGWFFLFFVLVWGVGGGGGKAKVVYYCHNLAHLLPLKHLLARSNILYTEYSSSCIHNPSNLKHKIIRSTRKCSVFVFCCFFVEGESHCWFFVCLFLQLLFFDFAYSV